MSADSEIGTLRRCSKELLTSAGADVRATISAYASAPTTADSLPNALRRAEIADDAVVDICMLLVAAAVQTTKNLIGNAILFLLRASPETRQAVVEDEQAFVLFLEEILRFASPVQRINRRTRRRFEAPDMAIPSGAYLVLLLGAGNRDESVFARGETFDRTRSPNPHLRLRARGSFLPGRPDGESRGIPRHSHPVHAIPRHDARRRCRRGGFDGLPPPTLGPDAIDGAARRDDRDVRDVAWASGLERFAPSIRRAITRERLEAEPGRQLLATEGTHLSRAVEVERAGGPGAILVLGSEQALDGVVQVGRTGLAGDQRADADREMQRVTFQPQSADRALDDRRPDLAQVVEHPTQGSGGKIIEDECIPVPFIARLLLAVCQRGTKKLDDRIGGLVHSQIHEGHWR